MLMVRRGECGKTEIRLVNSYDNTHSSGEPETLEQTTIIYDHHLNHFHRKILVSINYMDSYY